MKTYEIKSYKCIPNQDGLINVIESIIWEVTEPTVIDGTTYDIKTSSITQLPQVNPSTFIETNDLTKAQVVEWIETYSNVDGLIESVVNIKRMLLNPPYNNITPNFN
jgi:hypothetical protein